MKSEAHPVRVRISEAQPHANLRIMASAGNKLIQLREKMRSLSSGEGVKKTAIAQRRRGTYLVSNHKRWFTCEPYRSPERRMMFPRDSFKYQKKVKKDSKIQEGEKHRKRTQNCVGHL
ncbi:hypothetical protein NDU88_008975 [Pleurodeles waltl]|uniref:Uncharacterized protein n=1 Tax=Pleurodeles waltl TaxID=8319 RepID=A0AAV7NY63_PLEWA|nr:hypothetical protein NDU88_008975 [Pleurodeles waltl]